MIPFLSLVPSGGLFFERQRIAPQAPQETARGREFRLSLPLDPLFGNSPELFWRKVIYPSGLLRYAAGVRGVFPLTSRVPAPAYLWGGAYIVYRTVFPQLHAVENLLATIKQTEWKGGDFI